MCEDRMNAKLVFKTYGEGTYKALQLQKQDYVYIYIYTYIYTHIHVYIIYGLTA